VRDRGSRFFAFVAPAATAAEARAWVETLRRRFPDATHCCFAWRIGWPPAERGADAGEPSGTAGQPMLAVLRGAELTGVVAAVLRWFGGTKLGKGGLARAYAGALQAAVARLPTRRELPGRELTLPVPFARVGTVKRLLRPPDIELVAERYGEEAELVVRVAERVRAELDAALAELGIAPRP